MQAGHPREAAEASPGNHRGRRYLSLLWGFLKPQRLSGTSRAPNTGLVCACCSEPASKAAPVSAFQFEHEAPEDRLCTSWE